eukprot:CAMPEP_0179321200 /NCGR_PEP_ID=MMETSP0797-20121207/58488_1 /TAXON_ID=47934 /ORGANISM="Dinophysis acuminata, Strain DAEP01" /LENGTH=77 /DNA_ID=CAMNT_0021032815 /DNA_START=65 /DNA_END=294 /DNA_ORIENTATION=-
MAAATLRMQAARRREARRSGSHSSAGDWSLARHARRPAAALTACSALIGEAVALGASMAAVTLRMRTARPGPPRGAR